MVLLAEFLIVEMLNSFGNCGFNQQPGGPFSFTAKDWLGYEEAKVVVRELGFGGQAEYRAWSKENPEVRNELGLPSSPDKVYHEFEDWYIFLGNEDTAVRAEDLPKFEDAKRIVQDMEFKSQAEYWAWCKANPMKK